MSQRRQARILDVALEAGVGTATVDRVLNNRSGVSKKIINSSKSGFCVNHGDSKNLLKKINFFFKKRNNKTKFNT